MPLIKQLVPFRTPVMKSLLPVLRFNKADKATTLLIEARISAFLVRTGLIAVLFVRLFDRPSNTRLVQRTIYIPNFSQYKIRLYNIHTSTSLTVIASVRNLLPTLVVIFIKPCVLNLCRYNSSRAAIE